MRNLSINTSDYNNILNQYIQFLNVNGKGQEAKLAKCHIFQYYKKTLNKLYENKNNYQIAISSWSKAIGYPLLNFATITRPLNSQLKITPTVYKWQTDQIYVNFAARHLGGGVLNTGWVQEEFLITCLDLLPFISQLSQEYTELHKNPAIIRTNAIFEPNLKFYGRQTGLIYHYHTIKENVSQVFKSIDHPIPIYWLSMAAINLRYSNNVPTEKDVDCMLQVATRAFYLTLLTLSKSSNIIPQTTINTGNWGAGAFGWDPRCSFLIQWLAFGLAKFAFSQYQPLIDIDQVTFHYHTYDNDTYKLIKAIDIDAFGSSTPKSFPKQLIAFIR